MKICKVCKIEKELSFFSSKKKNIGGLNHKCKDCEKEYSRRYYLDNIKYFQSHNKKWNENNRELKNLNAKKYYSENKLKCSEKSKSYRSIHRDKLNRNKKKWYNKPIEEKRKYRNRYSINKKGKDPLYKLKCNLRSYLSMVISKFGFTKNKKSIEIIGCSFEEFKIHIESKFESWMTWDNRGLYNGEVNYGWDIDHIIPMSSAKNENDVYSLNHYTNLRPLCSKINRDIKRGYEDYTKINNLNKMMDVLLNFYE